jgi:hypothetical protein
MYQSVLSILHDKLEKLTSAQPTHRPISLNATP